MCKFTNKMSNKHPPPLFKPFRALGYITDSVPFAVQRRGKETFVTVSVGRTWQVRQKRLHVCIVCVSHACARESSRG